MSRLAFDAVVQERDRLLAERDRLLLRLLPDPADDSVEPDRPADLEEPVAPEIEACIREIGGDAPELRREARQLAAQLAREGLSVNEITDSLWQRFEVAI